MLNRLSARGAAMTASTAVAGATAFAGLTMGGAWADVTATPSSTEAAPPSVARAAAPVAAAKVSWARRQAVDDAGARKRARDAAQAARAAKQRASRASHRQPGGDPRGIARSMMSARYGWSAGQFSCVDALWSRESGWNVHAANSSSGAYGIPQALPGSKMSAMGSDWEDDAAIQIAWGLSYIKTTYGSPCSAWSAFQSKGWY